MKYTLNMTSSKHYCFNATTSLNHRTIHTSSKNTCLTKPFVLFTQLLTGIQNCPRFLCLPIYTPFENSKSDTFKTLSKFCEGSIDIILWKVWTFPVICFFAGVLLQCPTKTVFTRMQLRSTVGADSASKQ